MALLKEKVPRHFFEDLKWIGEDQTTLPLFCMYTGPFVFRQLTTVLSRYAFEQCVDRHRGNQYVKSFSCWQQFLCLSFGQLTCRESVRSIVLCLNAHPQKLYHLGFTTPIRLST